VTGAPVESKKTSGILDGADMRIIDESFNGGEVSLGPNEAFEVSLPENPTTGFRWRLRSDGAPVCTLEGDTFDAPEPVPGRGGTRRLRFRTVAAGKARIALDYARRWGTGEPARTFSVGIVVTGS
jgi:inhibitor of cysteine peptidase